MLDAAGMGGRSVYAFACHTASRLGGEMSRSGITWWGYTGAIQCPEDAAPFRILFVELFRFIREAFAAASTVPERSAVLDEMGAAPLRRADPVKNRRENAWSRSLTRAVPGVFCGICRGT